MFENALADLAKHSNKHLIMSTEKILWVSYSAVWVCWNEPLSRRVHMTIRKKDIQQERLIIGCKDITYGGKEADEE